MDKILQRQTRIISYAVFSLFSQVDVLLGGKVVSSLTNTYPYRACIEPLLHYTKKANNIELVNGLVHQRYSWPFYALDPTSDNTGLNKRHEFGKLSKTRFLQGRVHSDIFNQGKLLLNGLSLKVTFQQHKNNFVLLSAPENPTFKRFISRSDFLLRKVQLSSDKLQSI